MKTRYKITLTQQLDGVEIDSFGYEKEAASLDEAATLAILDKLSDDSGEPITEAPELQYKDNIEDKKLKGAYFLGDGTIYKVEVTIAPPEFKFNPLKSSGGGTNGERAETAYRLLLCYRNVSIREQEEAIEDLISDLCHYCDNAGFDAEEVIESALNNWREER